MDLGITIIFIASVLTSGLFIGIACIRLYRLLMTKENEFYVVKRNVSTREAIELIDFSQKRMERELSKDEEFKKAA